MEPTKQYWLKKEGVCRGGARIVPNQRSYCFRCHFCHAKNVPRESEITRAFPFLFSNGSRAISMRTLCHAGKFYGCRNQNCLCGQCIAIKCSLHLKGNRTGDATWPKSVENVQMQASFNDSNDICCYMNTRGVPQLESVSQ